MTLAAHALDFGFRDHTVGRGLDCALAAGEVVCLLGPNGSGKSTLLRTLLGVQPRLGGDVTLDGRDLLAWGAAERARRLAYVPQAADSYFDFSLRETVEMGRTAHRGVFAGPGAHDRDVAAAALERLGIARLADRSLRAVSGGERQLALIARALATEAAFLVMDEPTANLDYGNQSRVLDEVARLKAAGIGVLVSTHHPEHAFRIADRVLLLADGRLVAQGPTQETLTARSLSALYGRPIEVATVRLAGGSEQRVCVPSPAD
ncbi:MAG TPA: ABC transporter ATP-binding protein [Usitatibacteraceae bacterium]|nr:ABC transporter ATP-binding protein [Usitatibacteraceae bacterium]